MTPPTMLSDRVRDYLTEIGRGWTGRGCVVECGAWLGGGSVALADGLAAAGYDWPLYVYDHWTANASEVGKARKGGLIIKPGQDLEPVYRKFVEPHAPFGLTTSRCRIEQAWWAGHPIEVWILDAAKREGPFYGALQTFGSSWIAGHTIIGLLDYGFYRTYPADDPRREVYLEQEAFINRFRDRFAPIRDFGPADSPAFFRYMKPINWGAEL